MEGKLFSQDFLREQDEKTHGHYLTQALILAYMNAVAAGDFTTLVHQAH